jgi:hypothetical protein
VRFERELADVRGGMCILALGAKIEIKEGKIRTAKSRRAIGPLNRLKT